VPAGQQRTLGDLVVDGQREHQAGAGTADLLAEVEGDLRGVVVAGGQGDADHRGVGLGGRLHGDHLDPALLLAADDGEDHGVAHLMSLDRVADRLLGVRLVAVH
jgi:hypothetical protein